MRLVTLTRVDVYPTQLWEAVKTAAPNVAKWAEAVAAHPSVRAIYNEEAIVEATKKRIEKIRAQS